MQRNDPRLAAEADRLYWESAAPVAEIAGRLGISRRALYGAVRPRASGLECPECGVGLVYPTRSARASRRAECPACGLEQEAPPEEGTDAPSRAPAAGRPAPRTEPAAAGMGTAAAPDQPWDGELAAPIGTEAALLRSRLVLVGSAALAGVAVGAIAAMLVSRRS